MFGVSHATLVAQLLLVALLSSSSQHCITLASAFQNNGKLPTTQHQQQQQQQQQGSNNTNSNTKMNSSSSSPDESSSSSSSSSSSPKIQAQAGKIEELKQKEAALSRLLAAVRLEKLDAIRSRPLTIGVVGFGRFGQFIAKTFTRHGKVVATSRSDYTDLANGMGVNYVKLSDPAAFLDHNLDVIVLATSIVSFESTVKNIAPHITDYMNRSGNIRGPLIVDVLSVKEHPRQILLDLLPKECDILCTHPMFGPDSGKNGWHGLTFVYERTRIDSVVLDQSHDGESQNNERFVEENSGKIHSVHENSEAHVEGVDRIERFLSIWEEEGCNMVQLSCKDHDSYAANSQFLTHLMGRILGEQGLAPTPIDTKGFESVLKLVGSTTADSFDLFYGLYKYNQNSMDTIIKLKDSMNGVVKMLKQMEEQDENGPPKWIKRNRTLNEIGICDPDEQLVEEEEYVAHSGEEKKEEFVAGGQIAKEKELTFA